MLLCNRIAVFLAGGLPIAIGPGRTDRLEDLDGLLIGGGVDVAARLYGIDTTDEWPYDPDRDALELRALDWAQQAGKPVLGICRGAQLMNVHRGGTLILDLKTALPERRNPRSILPCKWVEIETGSGLHAIMRRRRTLINALHHQAVDKLGEGFRVTAREPGSGIVQGIELPGPVPWFGVQWHPEFLFLRPSQFRIFRALVKGARDLMQATPSASTDQAFSKRTFGNRAFPNQTSPHQKQAPAPSGRNA